MEPVEDVLHRHYSLRPVGSEADSVGQPNNEQHNDSSGGASVSPDFSVSGLGYEQLIAEALPQPQLESLQLTPQETALFHRVAIAAITGLVGTDTTSSSAYLAQQACLIARAYLEVAARFGVRP